MNSWKYHQKKQRETKICFTFEFLTSAEVLAGGVKVTPDRILALIPWFSTDSMVSPIPSFITYPNLLAGEVIRPFARCVK
jgi:hypothetical protein